MTKRVIRYEVTDRLDVSNKRLRADEALRQMVRQWDAAWDAAPTFADYCRLFDEKKKPTRQWRNG